MAAQDIIIRPIITEKTMAGNSQKKYTFEVSKDSTKIDVKRAVEELFGVKVSLTEDSKTIEFFESMIYKSPFGDPHERVRPPSENGHEWG